MAATKRNAGLTSAVPRATLNDEELVSFNSNNWNNKQTQEITNVFHPGEFIRK